MSDDYPRHPCQREIYEDAPIRCVSLLDEPGRKSRSWWLKVPYDSGYAEEYVEISFCPFCGEELP